MNRVLYLTSLKSSNILNENVVQIIHCPLLINEDDSWLCIVDGIKDGVRKFGVTLKNWLFQLEICTCNKNSLGNIFSLAREV